MASLYDFCPKCGAVTKNGKCTSCGRLLVGKSSNSTMDKWRSESRQWQAYNKSAHQDHCDDHRGDGNVYLNGEVIRKTSNYRSFDTESLYDSEKYKVEEYESDEYEGDEYASGEYESESSDVILTENSKPTVNVSEGNIFATVKPPVRKKKRGGIIAWIFIIFVAIQILAEMDIGLDDVNDMIYEWLEQSDTSSYNQPDAGDEVSLIETEEADDEYEKYRIYDGSLEELVLCDQAGLFNVNDEKEEAKEYTGDEEYFFIEDVINDNVGYSIKKGYYYYNLDKNAVNEKEGVVYPRNIDIFANLPQICDSGLSNEDELNTLIRRKVSECIPFGYSADSGEYYVCECLAYVTDMRKDVLSVAFQCYYCLTDETFNYSEAEYWAARVVSINIDMNTGEVFYPEKELNFTGDFTANYLEACMNKYGQVPEYVNEETIKDAIDAGEVAVFYTPFGTQVAVSVCDYYDWVSCNLEKIK